MEIYVKNLTFTLYCGGGGVCVCVGGGGAIKALLVLYFPDVGLPCMKYSESFAKIIDDAFTFVSLRTKSYLNAPYR